MTGRELIIYILENRLENEDLFDDGLKPIFMTVNEAAVKWECGPATVGALINMNKIRATKIGDKYYILNNEPNPFKKYERAD